jgi:hypothetical protein
MTYIYFSESPSNDLFKYNNSFWIYYNFSLILNLIYKTSKRKVRFVPPGCRVYAHRDHKRLKYLLFLCELYNLGQVSYFLVWDVVKYRLVHTVLKLELLKIVKVFSMSTFHVERTVIFVPIFSDVIEQSGATHP